MNQRRANTNYRDNGAIGAILDEYEKAIKELSVLLDSITTNELTTIVDAKTEDLDCRSIQTIMTHVIAAGYNYVIVIRKKMGEEIVYQEKKNLPIVEDYKMALNLMFAYNEQLFKDYADLKMEAFEKENQIKVKWGEYFSMEQLFEHAIVHILRHRGQIERFLIKLRN